MAYENIVYERGDDGVAVITLNRPKALNALNAELLAELEQACGEVAEDRGVRVLILTGAHKAFAAGADISVMQGMAPGAARHYSELGHRVLQTLEALPIPVLAAVNGFALGGGMELAMAADMIYAAEKARFGQPEVKLGLIPGFGGCVRLPRLVGPARAKWLIYSGEMLDAPTAVAWGVAVKVLPQEDFLDAVRAEARTIAARSANAIHLAKRTVDAGLDASFDAALRGEQNAFGMCFAHGDAEEGLSAFLEKREASFSER